MKKGHIVFLNGITSSGKTSIAKAIRILSTTCIMWLSLPMFRTLMELIERLVHKL